MTIAVLTGLVAAGMMFSSFTIAKQKTIENSVQIMVNVPVYWEGLAWNPDTQGRIKIKVYQVEGQCNSFYAHVIVDYEVKAEVWVRENPNYNPRAYSTSNAMKYCVSYNNRQYYFDM